MHASVAIRGAQNVRDEMSKMEVAIRVIFNNQLDFAPTFISWIEDNFGIYREFEKQALEIAKHRDHYSARTIAEFIRHETTLREIRSGVDMGFKINNNSIPEMSRLFSLLNPEHKDLFEVRKTAARANWVGRKTNEEKRFNE